MAAARLASNNPGRSLRALNGVWQPWAPGPKARGVRWGHRVGVRVVPGCRSRLARRARRRQPEPTTNYDADGDGSVNSWGARSGIVTSSPIAILSQSGIVSTLAAQSSSSVSPNRAAIFDIVSPASTT